MSIEAQDISKTFGGFRALDHVSLYVPPGELVALLGPSGSGKTTFLRIIAGLEVPDPGSGPIRFHDENVASTQVGQRRVGFVFQHYALFRHMTVQENVAFGLKVKPRNARPEKEAIADKVRQLLQLVQLEGLANRYPSQLSGGQRQRVALARALAVEPKILLLDEPFGALDAKVRQELRRWLRRLHDEIHLTSVFVTHDQEEAVEVADRLVIMNEGRIEQVGTPEEVFHRPATEFVMNFLGDVNIFHGHVESGKAHFGSLVFDYPEYPEPTPKRVRVFIRPHDLKINVEQDDMPSIRACVSRVNTAGPMVKLELLSETNDRIHVEISHESFQREPVREGTQVYLWPRDIRIFIDSSQVG